MYTLPNVLNKLTEIKNIKQNISNALVNQGQNMTNISFENFPEKVDNLRCNLHYIKLYSGVDDSGLKKILSVFNTNLFTSMINTFRDCYKLTNIQELDTPNVKDMSNMFANCTNLMNILNLDTSNVTNMTYTFINCKKLTSIPNFNTFRVENMYSTFNNCINLVDVPGFNTISTNNISAMFSYCNNLSNESIQNIVNMCLSSNIITTTWKNLNNTNSYSPLYRTIFNSNYYSNRLTELTAAGWKY